jgi:hypothetical protein
VRAAQQRPNVRDRFMLDIFYLAIGAIGFVALWGIVRACDRV